MTNDQLETLAGKAGMYTDLFHMGAGSMVYSPGCMGVALDELKRFAELVIEAARARQAPAPVEVSRLAEELKKIKRYDVTGQYNGVGGVDVEESASGYWVDADDVDEVIKRLATMASTPASEVPLLTDEEIAGTAACAKGRGVVGACRAVEAEVRRRILTGATTSARGIPGWKLVPIEPTREMLKAGCGAENNDGELMVQAAWRYMLAATPASPATEGEAVACDGGCGNCDGSCAPYCRPIEAEAQKAVASECTFPECSHGSEDFCPINRAAFADHFVDASKMVEAIKDRNKALDTAAHLQAECERLEAAVSAERAACLAIVEKWGMGKDIIADEIRSRGDASESQACCGNYIVGATQGGMSEMLCCGNPSASPSPAASMEVQGQRLTDAEINQLFQDDVEWNAYHAETGWCITPALHDFARGIERKLAAKNGWRLGGADRG